MYPVLYVLYTIMIVVPLEFTECQAFHPVVRIGSLHPLTCKSVALPLFKSKGETHSLAGGDPIPTMGQAHWYSRYTKIPLRWDLSILCCVLSFIWAMVFKKISSIFYIVFTDREWKNCPDP